MLLNVRDGGRWTRFRLPKASYTQDADHGWYTEWPRIREVGGGHLLMNMHDMFYDFPKDFRPGHTAGIRPISTFLKMVVDYADWNGRLVLANNDASRQGNPILSARSRTSGSATGTILRGFGRPAGWGGPWVADAVKADKPSEPFLLAGFQRRVVHLAHRAAEPVTFTLEIDATGNGNWTTTGVDHRPGRRLCIPRHPARDAGRVDPRENRPRRGDQPRLISTFRRAIGRASRPSLFGSLPAANREAWQSEGILQPAAGLDMPLSFAATAVDRLGQGRGDRLLRDGRRLASAPR